MQVTANGHVQRSAAEWRGIIERYRQSGMGMKEFCAQEGLTLRTFECIKKSGSRGQRSSFLYLKIWIPTAEGGS